MKRKRSVGTMVNRTPPDGDRELKQSILQRPSNEPRPRSGDGLGFRSGSSNGILENNKMDNTSQVSGGSSSIISRNDLGNGSLSNDRREHSSGLDKERATTKGSNKLNTCEDAQLGSQSPLTKGKAARAPRTGSGVVINTPNFPCSSGGIDGSEQPSCSNKILILTGASNRKRPLPTGSSSPPVARWGGQRREKISRTRRANVVSVSNFDEAQDEGFVAPDVGTRLSSVECSGVFYNRAMPNNTHLKLKVGNVPSPAAPSESEESIVHGNKSKEKGTDNGEIEDGTLNAAHKAAIFVLPTKENKVPPWGEIWDGVRKQGRSGRGSVHSKACLQLSKEKLKSLETAKPLKSGRVTSDKPESRIGRPLSKKVSDRKGSTRPLQIINSGSSELAGESDDDREELLAAATAVRNASCLEKSGPFWKKMEPIFAFVSSEDLALLKHQINFADELDASFCNMLDEDYSVMPDLVEGGDDEIDTAVSELKIRLYQQVMKKKSQLCKLEKVIQEQRDLEMRNLEQRAMNTLVVTACKKLLGGRRSHGSSHKSGASKVSKQLAMAFAKRTLARCQKFEETGQSCFSEPILQDALFSQPVHDNDAKIADVISSEISPNMHVESRNCQLGSRVSASAVSSNIIERHGPIHKIDRSQLDPYQGLTHFSEQTFVRNDPINRVKKREVLLDVVTGAASRVTPTVNSTLPGGAKWKKTAKDHNTLPKNSALKGSHPSLSSGRGECKTKTKPKQKIAHLSTSGNGLSRVTETTNMLPSMWESCEIVNSGSTRGNLEVELASSCSSVQDLSKETEDNIFTNLPLQGIASIDELDVADGLGGQGQDIGSWLNVDDDALQDNGLVGLEIPMDDLSELKLNF